MFDDEIEIIDAPKKRGRVPQDRGNIPVDDAKKQFGFAMEMAKINTGRVKSPEELAERFDQLFELAFQNGILPRYEHLVLVSGLPKSTYYDYGNENYEHSPNPQFSEVVKKAKAVISAAEASLATIGKIPAPVYIFREKNYGGLRDVQEIQAGPIQDPTKPKNEQEILDALPECPTPIEIEEAE